MKKHQQSERCWCRPFVMVVRDNADEITGLVTVHNVDSSVPVPVQIESARTNEQDTSEHHWSCRCRRCYPECA